MTVVVRIESERIRDWETFHTVFAESFGFPAFYGRNMNAWIDCMTYLDDIGAGMTTVHCEPGRVVTLLLEHAAAFATRCPEQYAALVECAAFVNFRRLESGGTAVLALAFS